MNAVWEMILVCFDFDFVLFYYFLHFNNLDNFDTKNGVQMNAVWEMILVCFDFGFVLFFFYLFFFFLGLVGVQ